jgi:CheY-like chemotaxis protein/predicted regulator of Ras-like GTPase activity (Roadblock/LC7/MglB family)
MKTILVVDDEPAVLFALSEALAERRRGIRVVTAANGHEAVEALAEGGVDLVVTDLRMPEMDGFELLAYLRRQSPHLPVFVMTALGSAEALDRLGSAGGLEVFEKPFDVDDLKRAIRERLAQRLKGRVENISLASFLQLLEVERKTCTLSVSTVDRSGRLFFRGGRPVGAETGELTGRAAALEIVTWEHADIEISDVCPVEGPEIEGGLTFLLMEGMRLEDEREREPGTEGEEPEVRFGESEVAPQASAGPDLSGAIREALERAIEARGALAAVLVDAGSGAVIAAAAGLRGPDVEAAAVAAAELARRASRLGQAAGPGGGVEDLELTTARRRVLLRPVGSTRLLVLVLDRAKGDVDAARAALAGIERTLSATVTA